VGDVAHGTTGGVSTLRGQNAEQIAVKSCRRTRTCSPNTDHPIGAAYELLRVVAVRDRRWQTGVDRRYIGDNELTLLDVLTVWASPSFWNWRKGAGPLRTDS
jgi:hypothetical protein